jgi:pimeloyl-ACP methyl ester carboxylesterase
VLFHPGAAGDGTFWRPVGERLPADWEKVYLSWPGLGDQPADPSVRSLDDLVERVAARLSRPGDLVAQSMGGLVAVRVAARLPERVRRLVLVATSGGVDVRGLGGADWAEAYRREYPNAAGWISAEQADQSDEFGRIAAPTLLIWGDCDPTSPVAVGRVLAGLIPDATLRVIPGGTHNLGHDDPAAVAPLIAAHFRPDPHVS